MVEDVDVMIDHQAISLEVFITVKKIELSRIMEYSNVSFVT